VKFAEKPISNLRNSTFARDHACPTYKNSVRTLKETTL